MGRWTDKATRATRAVTSALLLAALVTPMVAAADRDHDGLRDGFEAKYGVTSPDRQDSDWDGVVDSAEDNDGDRLSNHGEQRFGTNPGKRDSDGDGNSDGAEDHDRDGRSNAREQDQRPLPSGLKPSLRSAKRDRAVVSRECGAKNRSSKLVRCKDGDLGGDKTIVLMGDSHAIVFMDPIRRAARTEGWRVETLLKGACTPILGSMNEAQWLVDRGRSCRQWRLNALAAINADPPHLVILNGNDNAVFVDGNGRVLPRSQRPAAWRKGVERISDRLPAGTSLLVLGDVPDTRGNPVLCLKAHPGDMSRCTTRRVPLAKRNIEKAVRAAVAQKDQQFGTLYGKICSYDPCPVVQGKTLVWRSHGHLSATFARRLTPSLRKMIRNILD